MFHRLLTIVMGLLAKCLLPLALAVIILLRFNKLHTSYQTIYSQISHNDNITNITGKVINDPIIVAGKQKVAVKPLNAEFSGNILYYFDSENIFEFGNELGLSCHLEVPPVFDDFSYKDYLATKKILSVCYKPELISTKPSASLLTYLFQVKHAFNNNIQKIYPYKQALLVSGMLLGIEEGFPETFKQQLRDSGLLHMVVVSGSNLALVLTLFYNSLLYLRIKRRYAILIGLSILSLYCFMVGLSPPVLRALIMTSIVLLGSTFYRPVYSLKVLAGAISIMLLINPYLILSASFQLSASATFGLIVFLPKINKWLRKRKLTGYVWEAGSTALSAQIAVFPILWYQFGSFNPLIVVPNTLVAFVPPIVMALGFISGLLGFISLPLARLVGWGNYLVLEYFLAIVRVFSI